MRRRRETRRPLNNDDEIENPFAPAEREAENHDVAGHVRGEHVAEAEVAHRVDETGRERQQHQQQRERIPGTPVVHAVVAFGSVESGVDLLRRSRSVGVCTDAGIEPELARPEIVEGLLDLGLGVHHERTRPRNRFADRTAAEDQHLERGGARVLVRGGLDRDRVAVAEAPRADPSGSVGVRRRPWPRRRGCRRAR